MCGKWNVRQARLQQMFRVTTYYTGACFQSFSPLINCIVHHTVLKFSPCRNKMLPQLVRIADWYLIRVQKMKKMGGLPIVGQIQIQALRGSRPPDPPMLDPRLTYFLPIFSQETTKICKFRTTPC